MFTFCLLLLLLPPSSALPSPSALCPLPSPRYPVLPSQADIIVATPEKWDSITRRLRDNAGLVGQVRTL